MKKKRGKKKKKTDQEKKPARSFFANKLINKRASINIQLKVPIIQYISLFESY